MKEGDFGYTDLLYALLSTLNVLSTVLQQQSLLLPVLVLITTSSESDLMG